MGDRILLAVGILGVPPCAWLAKGRRSSRVSARYPILQLIGIQENIGRTVPDASTLWQELPGDHKCFCWNLFHGYLYIMGNHWDARTTAPPHVASFCQDTLPTEFSVVFLPDCISMSFRLSACLPVCLSVCLSVCLCPFGSVCVCVCLSFNSHSLSFSPSLSLSLSRCLFLLSLYLYLHCICV